MFGHMKLGKKAVRHDHRTLRLRAFAQNLQVPDEFSMITKMTDVGVMLNDQFGDCTCAGIGHMIQAWTANCGSQVVLADQDILALYEKACGYNPADPSTDQGGVEIDVLNYVRKNGVPGVTGAALDAYVSFNYKDAQQIKEAVYYFGGAYIGISLPTAWQNTNTWDVVQGPDGTPGSWGGHAIPILGYDPEFYYVISWGETIKLTYRAIAEYVEESYALLSPLYLSNGKTPEGFDLTALQQDLQLISA